jgi:hypothetical protein
MYNDFEHFKFWCQKVLPLVYDDSLSYYEVLDKVVKYLNSIIDDQKAMTTTLVVQGGDIGYLKNELSEINTELEKVKNGNYVSLYLDSLKNWVDNNLQELVLRVVKFVNFGLSDEGYFVANVPTSWDFITFDTDMDINSKTFGHLIMEW